MRCLWSQHSRLMLLQFPVMVASSPTFSSHHHLRSADSPEEPLLLYRENRRIGASVDSHLALFALKACARSLEHLVLHQIHADLCRIGLNFHVYVGTALISAYSTSSLSDAIQLFGEMPARNIVMYNTMITGLWKASNVTEARELFDLMPARDNASWSTMILGYIQNGTRAEAIKLFRHMMMCEMVRPDEITLVTLLSGLFPLCRFDLLVKSVHAFIEKIGWLLTVTVGTALVDMYAKSGSLHYARRVFHMIRERNVTTWSAMICGLAMHGCAGQALSMFTDMQVKNVEPNEITFTGVLNACRHAGLVKEGRKYFLDMTEGYKLIPKIQHYGCMVDLLGKAGLLEEAYNMIKVMKVEPNIIIWGSFLAACKMHRCYEMADKVLEQVLSLAKPDTDGGVYSLISDLYAIGGKWDCAARLRKLMIDTHVKKKRGLSCTEPQETL